jgi:hypothetical protein
MMQILFLDIILLCVSVPIDRVQIGDRIYWHLIQSTRTYKQYSAIVDLHNLQFTATHAPGFLVFTSRYPGNGIKSLTVTNKSSQADF